MEKQRKNSPYKTYITLWAIGLSFVFFTAATIQSWTKFSEIYLIDKIHFFLSISLAVVAFFLFIIYSIETYRELNLLNDYLDSKLSPRVKSKTFLTILILAIFFGTLISISHLIIAYSLILVVYNLFDLWGGWQVKKIIRPLIKNKLKKEVHKEEREIVTALYDYYFNNPTFQRVVTIMFFNWGAVCISIIFYFLNDSLYRNIAYVLIIFNIIIGEIIIYIWRRKRDKIIYLNENIIKNMDNENN